MYRAMGIDPSTKTGVALIEFMDMLPLYKPLVLNELTCPKKIVGLPRARDIAERVVRVAQIEHPDVIVIEGYGYRNAHTLALLVEIGTTIRNLLHECEFRYYDVTPAALKKFVTGKGNAKKDRMVQVVTENWGIEVKSDNVADAVGLAMFGAVTVGGYEVPKFDQCTPST